MDTKTAFSDAHLSGIGYISKVQIKFFDKGHPHFQAYFVQITAQMSVDFHMHGSFLCVLSFLEWALGLREFSFKFFYNIQWIQKQHSAMLI